ncbi:hypothetical protein DLAC_08426 [Tieghemostelium lacteum]|uniref:Uncharacterized protein n=1 Tax=Tieghemostelium lacteum TaxID=361077 RepID=A0A151ZBZ5_TIELA|nr:hypothetical protein DLAC_08426 [Tieghemostelium lacteum]|eukprot:KYQ91459.1 hypothetical protein DLAC_08426 [Tieghemostelium lacteum]
MKFYVNFEKEPEFTLIVQHDDKSTIQTIKDLKLHFIKEYKKVHGNANEFTSNCIDIKDSKNKVIAESNSIVKSFKNLDDAFVVKNANVPVPDAETTAVVASTKKVAAGAAVKPKIVVEGCDSRFKSVIESLLENAEIGFEKESYKKCVEIYNQVLEMYPEEKNSLIRLSQIYMQANKFEMSTKFIEKGLKVYPKEYQFQILYGKLSGLQKEFRDAAKAYKRALILMNSSMKDYDNTKAIYGRMLYQTGIARKQQKGCDILNEIAHRDESNILGLQGFAHVLLDRSQEADALNVLLKILTHVTSKKGFEKIYKKEKEWAQIKLTDLVKDKGSSFIINQFASNAQTIPLLAYISNMIKEFGAVEEATDLLRKAARTDTFTTSYSLALIHNLEVCNKYEEALSECFLYLKNNRPRGISQTTLTNGMVTQILNKYIKSETVQTISEAISWKLPMPETGPVAVGSDILKIDKPLDKDAKPYGKEELDMLSMWYTIIKILYVLGILEPLPELVKLLEVTRADKDLHLTVIRNEQAYFCCISNLMVHKTLPLPNYRPIYIAGDSHSMTASWTPIEVNGEKRLFHPLLTTGLKMWHLRPESRFFPKLNFYNVTTKAPKGSEIVFLFGEIDCREGILISVEKCRYASIEEGMGVTIDIYIKALKDLIKKYQYQCYIHPVVPTLNETRFLVKTFNSILKEKLSKEPQLVYLDFFEDLLINDSKDFNQIYALDGTHMNPSYVKLIESSINQHYTNKSK